MMRWTCPRCYQCAKMVIVVATEKAWLNMSDIHSVKSQLVLNVGIGGCKPPQPKPYDTVSQNSPKLRASALNSYDQTGKILVLTKLLRVSVEELFVFLLRVDLCKPTVKAVLR